MLRVRGVKLPPGADRTQLRKKCARILGVRPEDIAELRIQRRALDARRKNEICYDHTLLVELKCSEEPVLSRCKMCERFTEKAYELPKARLSSRPVVAGFGPAGMFAALALAECGARPIVLERGDCAELRRERVSRFWAGGELDPESNVQFGEGGAGAFSDGKLNTGTHDERIGWVLERLVDFGAGESIRYDARPHVGTDVLYDVIRALRGRVIELGGEVRFRSRLDGLEVHNGALTGVRVSARDGQYTLPCEKLILAVGHSARDTFTMLSESGIPMEPKGFSMGVRIEHPQSLVDSAQYGAPRGGLPAAEYRLNCRFEDGSSAYTFCMCPGGYVVAAASAAEGLVTNGMSYSGRGGENANSALLVTLAPQDFPYPGALGGMHWQRDIERAAFELGGGDYRAPAQTVGSFLGVGGAAAVEPTYRPGVRMCDLHELLPEKICKTLERAIPELGKKLRGFDLAGAVMTAPETRSSSPVRILRGRDFCSAAAAGLYPCGEGAGYAGGIVSAAVDGLRCAEAVMNSSL